VPTQGEVARGPSEAELTVSKLASRAVGADIDGDCPLGQPRFFARIREDLQESYGSLTRRRRGPAAYSAFLSSLNHPGGRWPRFVRSAICARCARVTKSSDRTKGNRAGWSCSAGVMRSCGIARLLPGGSSQLFETIYLLTRSQITCSTSRRRPGSSDLGFVVIFAGFGLSFPIRLGAVADDRRREPNFVVQLASSGRTSNTPGRSRGIADIIVLYALIARGCDVRAEPLRLTLTSSAAGPPCDQQL